MALDRFSNNVSVYPKICVRVGILFYLLLFYFLVINRLVGCIDKII